MVNALFHRLPAKIEAENYGHEGPGKSYFVKDTAQNAKLYRKSEPVPIEPTAAGDRAGLAIRLSGGEWTAYTVNSPQAKTYEARVRVKVETAPALLAFSTGGHFRKRLSPTPTGPRSNSTPSRCQKAPALSD